MKVSIILAYLVVPRILTRNTQADDITLAVVVRMQTGAAPR
jgi:hypothetical protein